MPPGVELKPLDITPQPEVSRSPEDADAARQSADVAAHLANERTFLAWSFTSLFIMSGGVALARTLIALNTSPLSAGTGGIASVLFYPTTMGLLFLTAGLAIMILAACRYLTVQAQITERRYRPCGISVMVYLAIMLGLCVVLAGYLLQLRGTL